MIQELKKRILTESYITKWMKMELTNIMLDQEEIPLLVTKNFQTISHVKGYHVYKTLWIPVMGECLLSEKEPDNPKYNMRSA